MSALATRRRTRRQRRGDGRRRKTIESFEDVRPDREREVARASGPSLEEVLERAWEDLASRGRAECLVCGGEMAAAGGRNGGECGGCGSELARAN